MPAQIIPGIFYKNGNPQQQEANNEQTMQLLNFVSSLHDQHNRDQLVAAQIRASQRDDELSQALFDSKVREQNALASGAETQAANAQQVHEKNAFDLGHLKESYEQTKAESQARVGESQARQRQAGTEADVAESRNTRENLNFYTQLPTQLFQNAIQTAKMGAEAGRESSLAQQEAAKAKMDQESLDRNHLLSMALATHDLPNGDAEFVKQAKASGLYGSDAWRQVNVVRTGYEDNPLVNMAVKSGDAQQIKDAAYQLGKEAANKTSGIVDANLVDTLTRSLTVLSQRTHINQLRETYLPETPVQIIDNGKILSGKIVSNEGVANSQSPFVHVNVGDDATPQVRPFPVGAVTPIDPEQLTKLQQNKQLGWEDYAKRNPNPTGMGPDGQPWLYKWTRDSQGKLQAALDRPVPIQQQPGAAPQAGGDQDYTNTSMNDFAEVPDNSAAPAGGGIDTSNLPSIGSRLKGFAQTAAKSLANGDMLKPYTMQSQ